LIGDRQKTVDLWRESFRVWFPKGKADPNLELIAVSPERGEYWEGGGSDVVKYIWEAAKAYARRMTPESHDRGLHGKVSF
jgi:general stress protein 26